MKKILVTGASGQIGSELTLILRKRYDADNIIAAGHRRKPDQALLESGPFHYIDCRDPAKIEGLVRDNAVDTIYHLAAVLSAKAEEDPPHAWDTNLKGLWSVLEVARLHACRVFTPSSIGVFGPSTPPVRTPQDTILRPTTMYGVTKVAGELLCDYYYHRYGVDTRGVRFPGLISHNTPPGGGTTDYAVDIFHHALREGRYTCYLREDSCLDMMYMPDALKAALTLMDCDSSRLKHRNAFNVTAMSFTPRRIAEEIKRHIPHFTMEYRVDPLRQAIADSWPDSMDDQAARDEWGWKPDHDLSSMTRDMLEKLSKKLGVSL